MLYFSQKWDSVDNSGDTLRGIYSFQCTYQNVCTSQPNWEYLWLILLQQFTTIPHPLNNIALTQYVFSVGLWNCQSTFNKADLILVYTKDLCLDILALTDTLIKLHNNTIPTVLGRLHILPYILIFWAWWWGSFLNLLFPFASFK